MKMKILPLLFVLSTTGLFAQTSIQIEGTLSPLPASSVKVYLKKNTTVVDSAMSNTTTGKVLFNPSVSPSDAISLIFNDCSGTTVTAGPMTGISSNLYVALMHCSPVGVPPCTASFIRSSYFDTTLSMIGGVSTVTAIPKPFKIRVDNTSVGSGLTYTWNFGDGSPTATGSTLNHTYATHGSYLLCLTISNTSGCNDTYCDTIRVDSSGNIRSSFQLFVNTPSRNASSIDDETATFNDVNIFPNPTAGSTYLQFNSMVSSELSIRIVDVKGALVNKITRKTVIGNNSFELPTNEMQEGLYFVLIQDGTQVISKRIQILD